MISEKQEKAICSYCRNPFLLSKNTGLPRVSTENYMFCSGCGTQILNDANFCQKCGKQLSASTVRTGEHWESCEIDIVSVAKSGLLTGGLAKWVARASGPNGNYFARESSVFIAYVGKKIEINLSHGSSCVQSLDILTSKLTSDGWEYIGTKGEYWQQTFRRQVK